MQFIVAQFTLDTAVGGPSAVESSLEGRQSALKSCRLLKQEFFLSLIYGETIFFDTSDVEASLRNMSAASWHVEHS